MTNKGNVDKKTGLAGVVRIEETGNSKGRSRSSAFGEG
jgi:hypothetical protein